MNVSKANIEAIKEYLHTHGIENESLLIELTDHFSCEIEERMEQGATFQNIFQALKEAFSPTRLQAIEAERTYYLTTKSNVIMLKAVFITSYISIVLMILGGILFKYSFTAQISYVAAGLSVGGVLCFCFAFLPTLFIFFYRRAVRWAKE